MLVIILRYVGGLERDDVFAAVDAVGQSHIVHGVEPSQRTTPERMDLAPTYTNEKLASGAEVEYIWQEAKGGGRPRAVILLAHGCSHGAVDFWPRDRVRCPRCKGLPEEARIVRAALARDFFVVALSSADRRGSRCWDLASAPDSPAGDFARARAVVQIRLRESG